MAVSWGVGAGGGGDCEVVQVGVSDWLFIEVTASRTRPLSVSHVKGKVTVDVFPAASVRCSKHYPKAAFTPKAKLFSRATESHEKSTYRRAWLR